MSLASHELRTPMTAIKSYSWMLLNKPNYLADTQRVKHYMEVIYTCSQRLIHLINDMLNISRIEAGRFDIHSQPVHLEQLVQEVFNEVFPVAQTQKLHPYPWATSPTIAVGLLTRIG